MSLDHWEGFDEWGLTQAEANLRGWATTSASPSQPTGRFSGFGYRWPNNTTTVRNLKVPATRQTIGFAWKTTNAAAAATTVCELREGATVHGRLAYNGNGTFTVSRAGTTFGATPTTPNLGISTGVWYYIELDYFCNDATGAYELRVNEVSVASGTGDSRNGGAAGILDIVTAAQPNATAFDWDDYYEASGSTSFQGDCRVVTSMPNADGSASAWTASAGADWQCVDEVPYDSDTTYISTAAATTDSTFTFPSTGVTGTVLGVQTTAIARKDDAAARNLALLVDTGTLDVGASQALGASYVALNRHDLVDPGTATAWAIADVNAAEFGVRNV